MCVCVCVVMGAEEEKEREFPNRFHRPDFFFNRERTDKCHLTDLPP